MLVPHGFLSWISLAESVTSTAGGPLLMCEVFSEILFQVNAAKDCSELYKVIGRDCWVVTPCNSTHEEGY